jgi:hypothetical protein
VQEITTLHTYRLQDAALTVAAATNLSEYHYFSTSMKRRKFLFGSLLTGGAIMAYGAFKWVKWNKDPDVDFLHHSLPLLTALADTIIPQTGTPSASECGVPQVIVLLLTECTDLRTQNKFIQGLKEVETLATATFGKPFATCNRDQRLSLLNELDENDKIMEGRTGRVQAFFTGKPFTITLREYCIIGYFTSEGGATQALRYAHVPGAYTACQPYASGEKAWATR